MAKLQDLRDAIDSGKTAVLRLSAGHPLNPYKNKVNVFIKQRQGIYYRRFYEDFSKDIQPEKPSTWEELMKDKDSADVLSDEWVIE